MSDISGALEFLATWFPHGFFLGMGVFAVCRMRERRRDPRRNYYAESEARDGE